MTLTAGSARGHADISSEALLVSIAVGLGALEVPGVSEEERALTRGLPPVEGHLLRRVRESIADGMDPLGDAFSKLRTPEERRRVGAVYTPLAIVQAMTAWSAARAIPERVVDPGVGSGRFLVNAGRRFPRSTLVGVDIDPLAALLARAHAAAAGMASRTAIQVSDFRSIELPVISGRTLYIGNPPYVRHHQVSRDWKEWFRTAGERLGIRASALAGLHLHFYAAIAMNARPGDYGALITASEWLDVNYGSFLRNLLASKLGGVAVVAIEPTAEPFPGTATTASISLFEVGSRVRDMRFSRVTNLACVGSLDGGRQVRREVLAGQPRWSQFTRKPSRIPEGYVELGELCRVHRGQVTGANKVWVVEAKAVDLPAHLLVPAVTRARELFSAGRCLGHTEGLKRVIDLPVDLDELGSEERYYVERFLEFARSLGAHEGYIARHRRAWWAVGLRESAPILATYMARRPPTFVLNEAGARHINVAHGLYPREPLAARATQALADYLRKSASLEGGRVYAGGLTKYEPREMERILVPSPDALGGTDA